MVKKPDFLDWLIALVIVAMILLAVFLWTSTPMRDR